MEGFRKIRQSISRAKNIAISGHINPDGDSIGSFLALGLALDSLGKSVYLLCEGSIPEHYRFLPGVGRIISTTNKKIDLAIAVDCSTIELLGKNASVFKKAKAVFEIDHHEFRKSFGDIYLVDHEAAAVGELIYMLLKKLQVVITRDIGENLLTSLIVETNLFKLANVRPFTFTACGELLKTGIVFSQLADKVYGQKTRAAMMLSAVCLLRAKFLKKNRIIWSVIRYNDLARVGGKNYDTDMIASEMYSMKDVKVAVLFREKNSETLKVSLRSKGGINIGKIAQEYKGGGHFDIAGCYIPNNRKSIMQILSSVEALLN
ncbi:MAG: bifunctional oligoribonuclease/PAP phosphatase NrnA [Candidatus Omnitrophota bacterium]|nr:bifunctional oligoribonuclease/PAP phosphatase NrnA [Candidatus Omnitrophota bacterium]MBU1928275.1 bifunctional oligoribonuclease/PAP phosphatase NrnA [Candidatus Omnitrophota bacterium]MBU2034858.1 bifunctional oligoribonuclease/PAP phosphatase NrnA [Candidatus Omnitrophota bacterium]MBU2222329.1 bifunctional oligoribonuclease/PAP phosphatase NrnA [Candidatus Omnitrophota bacterium]MBU2257531.1 bifunctional oligoribonuclease/PAP phosphatase NrnA [Candidatus Omnitrophota bacterium]